MSDENAISTEVKPASAADTLALLQSSGRSKYATEQAMTTVTKVGNYLPYIQLHGSNSKIVKQRKFPMGNFALVKNKVNIDLTDSFVAYLLSWRPKAMQYSPEVLSFYDVNSPQFKNIEKMADTKDSNMGFGAEFLIWLPEHKEIATLFLGNKTGRNEAPNIIGCLENGTRQCRINSILIEDKKNNRDWHGPKMMPYDLEINVFPSAEVLSAELEKFNNPPASDKAPAEKDEDTNERG